MLTSTSTSPGKARPRSRRPGSSGVPTFLAKVLDKDPNGTFVAIDDVELDDWGVGGLPVKEYRKAKAKAAKAGK